MSVGSGPLHVRRCHYDTQKALAAGVPVCVVPPFGRDRFDVAGHVQVADAGTPLPAPRLRPDRLRKAVRDAMEKKAGAERIAATFAADGGPRMAAEALKELLRNRVSYPTGRIYEPTRQETEVDGKGGRAMCGNPS